MGRKTTTLVGIGLAALVGLVPAACSKSDTPGTNPQTTGESQFGVATTTAPPATDAAPTAASAPLADGTHPGYIKSINSSNRTISFDLVEWYTGAEAVTAHQEDCDGGYTDFECGEPPPNDYWIRNRNSALRTLDVGVGVVVIVYKQHGTPTTTSLDGLTTVFADAALGIDGSQWRDVLYFITVTGGVVTRIEHMWLP